MPELRTVIVDDEPPARKRIRDLVARQPDVTVVGEASSGDEAVRKLETLPRPGLPRRPDAESWTASSARSLDTRLRWSSSSPPTTSSPSAPSRSTPSTTSSSRSSATLPGALGRARAAVRRHPAADDPRLLALLADLTARDNRLTRVAVKHRGRIRLVPLEEVEWIEASGNYLRLHVPGGQYLVRETMQRFAERLDPCRFARIHRSAIVNIERVRELTPLSHGDCSVLLASGREVTLSRTYREQLKARLGPEF